MLLVMVDPVQPGHKHVRLLAGLGKGGQAVYEQVPAAAVKSGVFDETSTTMTATR
jgi:hypothetical protein